MAKKTTKTTPAAKAVNPLVTAYTEGAQKVWYAGIGAVARVQEESGKVVEIVAKETRALELQGKKLVESKTAEVRQIAQARAAEARKVTTAYTSRVVEAVESSVATQSQRVLNMLGVPTSQNIRELTEAIDQLKQNVEGLQKARRAA
jgi:poly(hydroxyalkanoate) granule-associated protein